MGLGIDIAGLDRQVPAPPPPDRPLDPWERRRLEGFGASDIAPLMLALGMITMDTTVPGTSVVPIRRQVTRNGVERPAKSSFVEDRARPRKLRVRRSVWERTGTRTIVAVPVLAEKAGLVEPEDLGDVETVRLGKEREPALFDAFVRRVRSGERAGTLEPDAELHRATPREWLPLFAPASRMSATPDAWGRDFLGQYVNIELKCLACPAALFFNYWLQAQQQSAVLGGCSSLLVAGEFWSAGWRPPGRVVIEEVPPNPTWQALIREATDRGWDEVARMRQRFGMKEPA